MARFLCSRRFAQEFVQKHGRGVQKNPLPVDVRRSKTSLLKFPNHRPMLLKKRDRVYFFQSSSRLIDLTYLSNVGELSKSLTPKNHI